MKPHVTCHMMSSVDGRILSAHWGLPNAAKLFEDCAAKIKADAWIVGRTTMQEFSNKRPRRKRRGRFPALRVDFAADPSAESFAVVIDPTGKCHWKTNQVGGDHVIEVLTERVSGEYLDHLRTQNVSYVFGGKREIDLPRVLDKLQRLFAIRRVRIDGGGTVNGAFLAAGLIDEFSHVIVPVADGSTGTPTIFDIQGASKARRANSLQLRSFKRLRGGVLWCRYAVRPRAGRK